MRRSEIELNPQDFTEFAALHRLIRTVFAPMAGRIDPPSSITTMSEDDLRAKAQSEDLFVVASGGLPIACLFGTPMDGTYEIGKLAVDAAYQGQGLARELIEAAARYARAHGFDTLQLYVRVQLIENHSLYTHLGFAKHADFTHPGFASPTAIIFRRPA